MKKQKLLLLIIPLLITSCGIFKDKNLAKRYRNRTNKIFENSLSPQLFVEVDLNTSLLSSPKTTNIKYNILSLTDKGQEAYINSINSKAQETKELIKSISTNFNFNKSLKLKTKIIPNTLKKTLIFTVNHIRSSKIDRVKNKLLDNNKVTVFNNLGNRVAYLELGLRLSGKDALIFNSWDKYVTDKTTLNLGKVSSTQNWNASIEASAKGTGAITLTGSNSKIDNLNNTQGNSILLNTGENNTSSSSYQIISDNNDTNTKTNSLSSSGELGGNATIGYTDTYQTSVDLSSEILKLSGTLAEKNIILRQESGPGIDLSGNIIVSIEYKITDDWAMPIKFSKLSELYDGKNKPKSPSIIKNEFLLVVFPDLKTDIKGELDYKFLYRQVNKGNRHLPEARQKVTYYHGEVKSKDNNLLKANKGLVTLIKKEEIRPKGYLIGFNKSKILRLNNEELRFETTSEAINFLAYLNDLVIQKIPIKGISLNGKSITTNEITKLKILTFQF